MVKKLNRDGVAIRALLDQGFKQCEIMQMLKLSKQKVYYWKIHEVKTEQKRRKKLSKFSRLRKFKYFFFIYY